MPNRKVPLVKNEVYHIYNKSIAEFKIFNSDDDYERIKKEMIFYSIANPPCKFSSYKKLSDTAEINPSSLTRHPDRLVDIISYCIMPTHIHLLLKELKEQGIRRFITSIQKSYSQYFNLKCNRKGPLWEHRFKNVLVDNDEQFIHLTRYIHLNPVTAYIVNDPGKWRHSSYGEYVSITKKEINLCNFSDYITMNVSDYRKFVNDQIDYQRTLARIKNVILE